MRSLFWLSSLLIMIVLASPLAALTISPGGGEPGGTVHLAIHEPGIIWAPDVQVELGPGFVVQEIRHLEGGALLATIEIGGDLGIGTYDMTVSDAANTVTAADLFEVGYCGCGSSSTHDTNVVVNPGFETGTMSGWIPATWTISTVLPHGGTYCAYDAGGSGGGGLCIRQNFSPAIDSDDIVSFTFWIRQIDDAGIAQVAVFHQTGGGNYGVAFPPHNDDWGLEDHTDLVWPNNYVTGIHVCGFGGGYPDPDDSWVDDFTLDVAGATPVTPSTWGAIKATMR